MTFKEYLKLHPFPLIIENYLTNFNYVQKSVELQLVENYLLNYWIPKFYNYILNMDDITFFDKFNDMIINNLPIMINGIKQHNFIVNDNILSELKDLNISGESVSATNFSNVGYAVTGDYQTQGTNSVNKSVDLLGFMERFNVIFLTLTERMTAEILNFFQLLYYAY